jgi:cephalosporin-C deacetylase-like acetyl esterase
VRSAKLAVLALLSALWPHTAQPQRDAGPRPRPADDPLLRWMDRIAQEQLRRRKNEIAQIRTAADAERRQRAVREKILNTMGGLPEYQGPLHARVTGNIHGDSFTIEKVIYESLPGFFITANLYRPNQAGRYPGVLLQSGHTQEGKPESQRLAINLALKGFVVLAFDPMGGGEREQTYSKELDRSAAGWTTMEHLQAEAQTLLLGQGMARYFIWDAMRSLDYLASRPDVDASRIGAVGCSGGGALTAYIGALDARVKAVAPACSTNSFELEFGRDRPMGEFHAEMSLPGFLAAGLDTADFVELAAPKPWMILATEGDYFTPDAAKIVYQEARAWYRLFHAEDNVEFFVGSGPHGTPLETRETVYRWMIRWLKDGQGDARERPVRLYNNFELQVTRSGRVDDEPGSRRMHQIILEDYRARKRPGTVPELLTRLRELQIPSDASAVPVKVLQKDNHRLTLRLETEAGIEIGAKLYLPGRPGRKGAVVVLADSATERFTEKITKLGWMVLELAPRDSPWSYDNRPLIGNWAANTRADHIGRNLPAMRAHDIVRAVDVLTARDDVDASSIRGAARGVKGVWLLAAAAVDPRIGKIWLDRTPHNFRSALERPVNTDLFEALIPGLLLRWDLEDLVKAMGNRSVLWTDPANWSGKIVIAGPSYRYRYPVGDATDFADAQDDEYLAELLR